MREIKFRAWDETTKYMVSELQIQTLIYKNPELLKGEKR